mgnify:CR=1 FL=1
MFSVGNPNGKTNNTNNNTQLIRFVINNDTIRKKETNESLLEEKNKTFWTKIKRQIFEENGVGNTTKKNGEEKQIKIKKYDFNDRGTPVKLKSGLFDSLLKMFQTPKLKEMVDNNDDDINKNDGKTNDDDDVNVAKQPVKKREKPFIFFKFLYKIRKSPLPNASTNDKKLNGKKKKKEITKSKIFSPFDGFEKDFFNDGIKENGDIDSFLNDFSIFHDDPFLKNGDTSVKNSISDDSSPNKKKLKRIKRMMLKKSLNIKNDDLKFISDILNEPFLNMNFHDREYSPVVKFFEENPKYLDDEKWNGNIKIQRNVKYFDKDHPFYTEPISLFDQVIFKTKEPHQSPSRDLFIDEFKKKTVKSDEDSIDKMIDVPLKFAGT